MYTRALRVLLAVMIVSALMPLGTASAARNRAPRILKAVMKDGNGNGLADRVVLTYNEKIRHKADFSRFPFVVQGYKIAKVGAVRGKTTLAIALKENANAPTKPASIKYMRTRKQPVLDLKRLQAAKQLLTKNIIGLAVTAPPPPPAEEYTLAVSKSGEGLGLVTDDKSKINCGTTCTAKYPAGTSVTLTATPDAASDATFAGWTGCASSTETTCTVSMDADRFVGAAFAKAGEHKLTVLKAGAPADGTVASSSTPAINCGPTCEATYPAATVVTLTATPNATSTFVGWSGGGCTGTQTTCNVTMDAPKTVTATFGEKPTNSPDASPSPTPTASPSPSPSASSFALNATAINGTLTCLGTNGGTACVGSYPAGTVVTLTALPGLGMDPASAVWSGCAATPANSLTCAVTMDSNKTVTVSFSAVSILPGVQP